MREREFKSVLLIMRERESRSYSITARATRLHSVSPSGGVSSAFPLPDTHRRFSSHANVSVYFALSKLNCRESKSFEMMMVIDGMMIIIMMLSYYSRTKI